MTTTAVKCADGGLSMVQVASVKDIKSRSRMQMLLPRVNVTSQQSLNSPEKYNQTNIRLNPYKSSTSLVTAKCTPDAPQSKSKFATLNIKNEVPEPLNVKVSVLKTHI